MGIVRSILWPFFFANLDIFQLCKLFLQSHWNFQIRIPNTFQMKFLTYRCSVQLSNETRRARRVWSLSVIRIGLLPRRFENFIIFRRKRRFLYFANIISREEYDPPKYIVYELFKKTLLQKAGSYTAEEIIEDCSNALKFNPSYAKAYFRRARYNEKAKNYQEGLVGKINKRNVFDNDNFDLRCVLCSPLGREVGAAGRSSHDGSCMCLLFITFSWSEFEQKMWNFYFEFSDGGNWKVTQKGVDWVAQEQTGSAYANQTWEGILLRS